jgi:hypothetical protein
MLDAYLRMYDRQMSHYERTQGVEWKGNFGVWALLAGGIALAVRAHTGGCGLHLGLMALLLVGLVVLAHGLWLCLIHESERADKQLWCDYRRRVVALLTGAGGHESELAPPSEPKRTWRAAWFLSEVIVTLALGVALWLIAH